MFHLLAILSLLWRKELMVRMLFVIMEPYLFSITMIAQVLSEIASPQFASAELHETTLSGDVYRMRQLPTLTIPPGSATELREGAQHIMLMGPIGELALGDPITLFIRDSSGGELVVRSSLEARIQVEGN